MIVGINGSPLSGDSNNMRSMIKIAAEASKESYEIVDIGNFNIRGCCGVGHCFADGECFYADDDDMAQIRESLESATGIILGSPAYHGNVTGQMKTFMDRCTPYYVSRKLNGLPTIVLSVAGHPNNVEFDATGQCAYHTDETDAAIECTAAMRRFSKNLGLNVLGQYQAIHPGVVNGRGEFDAQSDPAVVRSNLEALGGLLATP